MWGVFRMAQAPGYIPARRGWFLLFFNILFRGTPLVFVSDGVLDASFNME